MVIASDQRQRAFDLIALASQDYASMKCSRVLQNWFLWTSLFVCDILPPGTYGRRFMCPICDILNHDMCEFDKRRQATSTDSGSNDDMVIGWDIYMNHLRICCQSIFLPNTWGLEINRPYHFQDWLCKLLTHIMYELISVIARVDELSDGWKKIFCVLFLPP